MEEFQAKNRAYRLPGRNLPDSTQEKLRHRQRRARWNNVSKIAGPFKIFGFILLIISLCYLAVVQLRYLFFSTSYFELKKIEVVGNQTLTAQEVINISGVNPGLNVFKLNKESVLERLESNPVIKDVAVELQGLYTLKIKLSEREPIMYAKVGTTFYEIAEDGTIIDTRSLGNRDLPIITGLNLQTSRAGDKLVEVDSFFIARRWVKKLGGKILQNISEINFSNLHNPYIFLENGVKIFPKNLDDFKKRYVFLCALLDNLGKNNVEPIYLDMRAPSIVVRPGNKTGASEGSRGSVAGG
ncbi:MAG: cell division protein FtsQ/DivIB [Candidatus Rifleibacteriota bacterium]